jgi:hypothetical protein
MNLKRRSDPLLKSLSLSALLSALRGHAHRALVWLPWLVVALLIAAVLSPGMAGASRLAFQSPESPPPEGTATETPIPPVQEVPPTATRPPAPTAAQPPAPTATQPPAPPAAQPPATQAAPTPTQAAPGEGTPPAQAAPAQAAPPGGTPPAQAAPTQAAPGEGTPPAQATPPATGSPSPTAKAPQAPAPSPTARPTRTPTPEPEAEGEATINWVKFWDTLVVWLAYPWMCCGVGLLLLVPVVLLYLEISGRRRPPLPPEIPPEPVDEEFAPDEEFDE